MRSLLVVLLLVVCQHGQGVTSKKLQLGVYYESKCPDTVRFVKEQLVPAVKLLYKYLELTLVPFGKADSINNGKGGFRCQHGQSECLGNRLQDCALHAMERKSVVDKVSYLACEMQSMASAKGEYQCVRKANLPVTQVRRCVESDEGTQLQLRSEYVTKNLNPSFIPSITIDKVFKQRIQDNGLRDLTGTLCQLLNNPPPCS